MMLVEVETRAFYGFRWQIEVKKKTHDVHQRNFVSSACFFFFLNNQQGVGVSKVVGGGGNSE